MQITETFESGKKRKRKTEKTNNNVSIKLIVNYTVPKSVSLGKSSRNL